MLRYRSGPNPILHWIRAFRGRTQTQRNGIRQHVQLGRQFYCRSLVSYTEGLHRGRLVFYICCDNSCPICIC
nr:unnamed protein product [Callosobruchus chinensis]